MSRSSPPDVFLGKGVLKKYSKFTGDHPRRSAVLRKSQSNFIEIAPRHGCFFVKLQHIFRIHFPRNTSKGLLLHVISEKVISEILNPFHEF